MGSTSGGQSPEIATRHCDNCPPSRARNGSFPNREGLHLMGGETREGMVFVERGPTQRKGPTFGAQPSPSRDRRRLPTGLRRKKRVKGRGRKGVGDQPGQQKRRWTRRRGGGATSLLAAAVTAFLGNSSSRFPLSSVGDLPHTRGAEAVRGPFLAI